MKVAGKTYRTVWMEGGVVKMIDQNLLPFRFEIRKYGSPKGVAKAIKNMTIRGAGAIGAAGAFGVALAGLKAPDEGFIEYVESGVNLLKGTRPTAKNLFYGIDRVFSSMLEFRADPSRAREVGVETAQKVADEDERASRSIGEFGESLIKDGDTILTHCNAGWLAFVDWGTALSPIYHAYRRGKRIKVLVDETRPRSQGARLTAWELKNEGIPFELISDTASASFMQRGEVDLVIIGADRIAKNGDTANKIGSLSLAISAKFFGIPFYVAAPSSTMDPDTASGTGIIIEERSQDEVLYVHGIDESGEIRRVRITAEGVGARNPAFDVVPAHLITAFITEKGIVRKNEDGPSKYSI